MEYCNLGTHTFIPLFYFIVPFSNFFFFFFDFPLFYEYLLIILIILHDLSN